MITNNRDMPRVMKTKFPAMVIVFGVVSNEGHIMPPHIFEVGLKVNTKVYLDVLKSVVIPWCNQVAGARFWVWQQDSAPAKSPKRPRLGFRRSATTWYLCLPGPLLPRSEPAGLLRWVIRREHHQHDLPQHQSQPDRRHLPSICELPPALVEKACSRSGSVSRCWLRLKVATLNRCQLYYIIKLPELVFQ